MLYIGVFQKIQQNVVIWGLVELFQPTRKFFSFSILVWNLFVTHKIFYWFVLPFKVTLLLLEFTIPSFPFHFLMKFNVESIYDSRGILVISSAIESGIAFVEYFFFVGLYCNLHLGNILWKKKHFTAFLFFLSCISDSQTPIFDVVFAPIHKKCFRAILWCWWCMTWKCKKNIFVARGAEQGNP